MVHVLGFGDGFGGQKWERFLIFSNSLGVCGLAVGFLLTLFGLLYNIPYSDECYSAIIILAELSFFSFCIFIGLGVTVALVLYTAKFEDKAIALAKPFLKCAITCLPLMLLLGLIDSFIPSTTSPLSYRYPQYTWLC